MTDKSCLFCNIPSERILRSSQLHRHCYAIRDNFPVTDQHTLIIPRRHVASFFNLSSLEKNDVLSLLEKMKNEISAQDPTVSGFNVGINDGEAAGQTIFHCHVHLIPRRVGDIDNPRGGVRGVIPDKRIY